MRSAGTMVGVWPMRAAPHCARMSRDLGEGELGVEAGDGFELVESAAGVAEGAAADHGDDDSGDSFGGGMSEAGGGEDGGDEEGGLVADAAGGVLVDR